MSSGIEALSDKERQTLRLLIRGHDAKSAARALDLSVHTINERLRDARRKLAVSSSREAARLLFEHEGEHPDRAADKLFGEAAAPFAPSGSAIPDLRPVRPLRSLALVTGTFVMLAFALLAFAILPHQASAPTAPAVAVSPDAAAIEATARRWLQLVDEGRWQESWAMAAPSFRALNTVEAWAAASAKARVPLGAVRARTLIDQQDVPGPPSGYRTVRFRTDFANKAGAVETLSLAREDGAWRVVGIYID